MLLCVDGSLYTGYTTDVSRRLAEHNGEGSGKVAKTAGARYTRGRRPVQLKYFESFSTRSQALKREAVIKKMPRQEKLELIESSTK